MRRAADAAHAALDATPDGPPGEPDGTPRPDLKSPNEPPIPVGLVFVRIAPDTIPTDPTAREALARAFRDVTRQLGTTGAAWSFPTAAEGPEYHYTGPATLGGLVLALRAES